MSRAPTVPTLSQLGNRYDLEVRQGSTLGPYRHYVKNPDGTPFNFTGCTVQGQVRTSAQAYGPPAAEMTITMPGDLSLGYYDFSVADEQTATVPMSGDVTTFKWDIEVINLLDQVIPLLYGDLRVKAEVTREDTEAPDPVPSQCC